MYKKSLKIALLSTPWESSPPPLYGGTELIAYNIAEELVKRGHKVTIFATGDSKTSAKLVSVFQKPLYRENIPWSDSLHPIMHAFELFKQSKKFDIIHNHFNYYGLMFSRLIQIPIVTTYHGDFASAEKIPEKKLFLQKYKRENFISISNSQRKFTKTKINFIGTVYNGINTNLFPFSTKTQNYLAWLGRITEKKGILEAIAVAKKLKMKLLIGAKIDVVDKEFYNKKVKKLINNKSIIYLGELEHKQKVRLLKNALALVNPIKWNEPFGLVMTESMACGTPIISFPKGAAPEIIMHNKTGFLVNNINSMAAAVKKIHLIKRADCRKRVEKYFSQEVMVDGYEKIYYKILNAKKR